MKTFYLTLILSLFCYLSASTVYASNVLIRIATESLVPVGSTNGLMLDGITPCTVTYKPPRTTDNDAIIVVEIMPVEIRSSIWKTRKIHSARYWGIFETANHYYSLAYHEVNEYVVTVFPDPYGFSKSTFSAKAKENGKTLVKVTYEEHERFFGPFYRGQRSVSSRCMIDTPIRKD